MHEFNKSVQKTSMDKFETKVSREDGSGVEEK